MSASSPRRPEGSSISHSREDTGETLSCTRESTTKVHAAPRTRLENVCESTTCPSLLDDCVHSVMTELSELELGPPLLASLALAAETKPLSSCSST